MEDRARAHATTCRRGPSSRPVARAVAAGLLLPCLACACTARTAAKTGEERLLVDRQLDDAADLITRDLAVLTGSTQRTGRYPVSPASRLVATGTLVFDGPLEEALAKACAAVGYRLVVRGEAPDLPAIVHVHMTARPWLAIFRAIGRQTGPGEVVRLWESARLVELSYRAQDTGRDGPPGEGPRAR